MSPAKLWQVKNPVFAGLKLSQLTKQRCGGGSGKIRVTWLLKPEQAARNNPAKGQEGTRGFGAMSQHFVRVTLHTGSNNNCCGAEWKQETGWENSCSLSIIILQPKICLLPSTDPCWSLDPHTHSLKEQEEERKAAGNQPYLCSNNCSLEQIPKPWLCL